MTLVPTELGAIEVDCQVLFTEDQSQALLVLIAPPRTEGYEKLQPLVSGHEHFAEAGHGQSMSDAPLPTASPPPVRQAGHCERSLG